MGVGESSQQRNLGMREMLHDTKSINFKWLRLNPVVASLD